MFMAHGFTVSFLKCSIPFSLDDITKTMPIIEMADDDLLRFVRENPGFAFLLQRGE